MPVPPATRLLVRPLQGKIFSGSVAESSIIRKVLHVDQSLLQEGLSAPESLG